MANNFDRFLPDWQLGTLTLSAGSTAFTAADAMLTLAAIREGDTIFTPSGLTLVIESITDDNNGVLSSPCPPAAAGTLPTRIRFQSDNSRYTGQVTALIQMLSGGNVSALGKLALDEGDYLRASGVGVIGKVQGKNLDALAELVAVEGKIISFTDADTMMLLDAPPADAHENLAQLAALAKVNDQFVVMGADGTITLKSIKSVTDAIAENADAIADNATEIDKKYALPIGGTMEQLIDATGMAIPKAGLPISLATQLAIDELQSYGTNSNGEFWRFKSGLQITARASGTTDIASSAGSLFVNGAAMGPYTLAASFVSAPFEILTGRCSSGNNHSIPASVNLPSTTHSSSMQIFRTASSAATFYVTMVHIGRWK